MSIQSKLAFAAVIAAYILAGVVEANALTANEKHSIKRQCEVETGTRTRVSWRTNPVAARRCYDDALASIRQQEIDQSYIDVNNALADYLVDNTRPRYRKGKGRKK